MQTEDLHIVLAVAKLRSITAAANQLDMRTSTASAAVKRVEANLGVDLFVRTTRQLRLSAAGERYLPQCQQALSLLDSAKMNMQEDSDVVAGELRISAPSDLGRNVLTPWLDEFIDAHPQVSIRMLISDSQIDFYRDSIDLAFRYGFPNDANLYGFKICNVPRVVCATPAYLAKHGTPAHPQELTQHNGLFYQLHDVIHDVWKFTDCTTQTECKVKMSGNRAANDGELVHRWCAAGKGIAAKSSLDMAADLLANRVQPILTQYPLTSTELWLVTPSKQAITPAVRLLRDHFREKTKALLDEMMERGVLGIEGKTGKADKGGKAEKTG